MRSHFKRSAACLVALAACAGGCDGCPGGKPYTPYTITDAPVASGASSTAGGAGAPPVGDAPTDAGADAAPAPAPAFTAIPAAPAQGDGKTWTIDPGVVATAPAGRAFALGLVLDADGDQKRDLIAWALAPDGLRGELRFTPGSKPGDERTIAALPGDLSLQGCSARASLAQVGPRSVAFDFEPQCGATGFGPRRATRWIAVLRFGKQEGEETMKGPELGLEIRVASLPVGESVDIAIDGSDRDGDARDDISAKLSLSGALRPFSGAVGPYPSVPVVSALVTFFDRPTGLSRDPSQPSASLLSAASALLADAKKKDTAPKVAAAAHQLRRLRSILCEESGRELVTTSAGPVRCEDARDVEHAAIAEVTAAVTRGDPARALVAIARLDALPSLSDARKKEILKLLGKTSPFVSYQLVHRAAAAPKMSAPAWGPLAFDASGDLLVRTAEGVTRVDHATFAEGPAGLGVDAWPSALTSEGAGAQGDAWVLASVEQRCESPVLLALIHDAAASGEAVAAQRTSIALPVLSPVSAKGLPSNGRCSSNPSVPITPLGASSELGLLFGVGPELVALKRQRGVAVVSLVSLPLDTGAAGTSVPGAARSPDGATIALPTSRGLLVATAGGSARLWSGPEMEQATACAPASGGGRVACVGGGAALLYEAR